MSDATGAPTDARNYKVIEDPEHGYRRLDPVPSDPELKEFYESQYYDLLRAGGRAPELRRLTEGGPEADRERAWLDQTMHADIAEAILEHRPGTRVLDVGCGFGDLLAVLKDRGIDGFGIEPSDDAAKIGRDRGLDIATATVESYAAERSRDDKFGAVVMLNVLEHVPNPFALLTTLTEMLEDDALLYIRVPNDFNPLQDAAQKALGTDKQWWIAAPDHINYFSIESLTALTQKLGYEPIDTQADWPMELFLLMGMDYIADPAKGPEAHQMRLKMDTSLPSDVRQNLWRALAQAGIGRNTRLLSRLTSRPSA